MNKIAITLLAGSLALGGLGLVNADDGRYQKGEYHKGQHCKYKGEGKHAEYRLQRMTERLGLSEDQATQVQAIWDKYSPQKQQLRSKMHESRQQLREAMNADSVDEGTLQKLAEASGALETEKILLRSKMHSEINQVLSPEQIEKRKQMGHRGGYRHKRHGYRQDI
jgi:Spy/CpxP family protein refolding chaperone